MAEDWDDEGPSNKEYVLTERSELRLECSQEQDVLIELLEGSAEIFGWELQRGTKVNVKGHKLPVYTWSGCKLLVDGRPTLSYQASDTPMPQYLELHTKLNALREKARAALQQQQLAGAQGAVEDTAQAHGPCVVVVGPTDSGKSSLTRMLLNWGVRTAWEPTFVDLDVGQGTITAPGCLSAVPTEAPLDPEEGAAALDMPLVMFYGHVGANDNPELYKYLVDRLAAVLERRAASNAHACASGLVVNTMGWIEGLGYELQLHVIQALKADVVVVLEQDRLHSQLSSDLKGRPVEVVKLPKSGGVVTRERDERRAARDRRLREYFYGPKGNLMPVTQTVRADALKVFRVGGGPRAPTSALPIGAVASAADPLRVSHVPVAADLVQSVLAVSHAETPEQVLATNVAGFILVKDVDMARNSVTFVAPCPGALPGKYLLSGSLRSAVD